MRYPDALGDDLPADVFGPEDAAAAMKTDALNIDAAGLPLFEQEALALQDLDATLMTEWASPEDEQAFNDH